MTHQLWTTLTPVMTSWHQGKLFIEYSLNVSHESLHIFIGLLVWLVLGLLLRWPLTYWRPWLCLLGLILWNEAVDLWIEQWPDPGQQYGDGAKDVLLTMAVPTLIMFTARRRPDLFQSSVRNSRGRA